MAYINYRENNPFYSPGLSTYTSSSEKGDKGQSGLSIYYNDGIITDNKNEEDRVIQNILSGSVLSSTESYDEEIVYKTGDIIIDGNADIYSIKMNGALTELNYVGTIRQSMGKAIYKKEGNWVVIESLAEIYGGTDPIKLVELNKDYGTGGVTKYVKLINTVTGEIAIFDVSTQQQTTQETDQQEQQEQR